MYKTPDIAHKVIWEKASVIGKPYISHFIRRVKHMNMENKTLYNANK